MRTLEEIYGKYAPPKLQAEPQPVQVQPAYQQGYNPQQASNGLTPEQWAYLLGTNQQEQQPAQAQAQQIDAQQMQPENYSLLDKLSDIGANAWDQDTLDKIAQDASDVQYIGSLPQEQYVAEQVNNLNSRKNHAQEQGFTLPM